MHTPYLYFAMMKKVREFFYSLMTDKNKSLYSYPIKFVLWTLSLIYGMILWMRDIWYAAGLSRSKALRRVKVISIGNITVGGTGKTPMAIKIAALLEERGRHVAVLLRGYGTDEHKMLKEALGDIPVIKGKNRVKSGKEAMEKHNTDTLILDDGFQYRKLRKDFNILLIDAGNPFGNGHLLPRGILRDKIRNIRHADAVVLTKARGSTDAVSKRIKEIAPGAELFTAVHKPVYLWDIINKKELDLSLLKKRRIASLSGIGDPGYFNELLGELGANKILEYSFLDHHDYTQQEIDEILNRCRINNVDTVVTTQKDAAKLAPGLNLDETIKFYFLKIRMDFIKDETRFLNRLLGICNG